MRKQKMTRNNRKYNKISTMIPVALGLFLIAVIILQTSASAQTVKPLIVKERYETMPFAAGALVIPMDGKQNDTVLSFGLVHALLRNETICYRLIGPPDSTIVTNWSGPAGAVYSGGPILLANYNLTRVQFTISKFPSVTIHNVTSLFISTMVYKIERPTKILVVHREGSDYQHSFSINLLDKMEIPYQTKQYWHLGDEVVNNPEKNSITENDLIIIEAPGGNGQIISELKTVISNAVKAGKNFVFIEKAMKDLTYIFPGSVSTDTSIAGMTFNATFTHTEESPSQYGGNMSFSVKAGDMVAITPGYEDLKPMLYTEHGTGYTRRTLLWASYFRYGRGLVEILSFNPGDANQTSMNLAASILYGNRFVQAPPALSFRSASSACSRSRGR